MAISASCPQCGHAVNVADHLAGKKMRCKECQAVYPVEAEDSDDSADERPRSRSSARVSSAREDAKDSPPRRKRDEASKNKRRPQREGGGKGVLVAAAAVVVVLLLVVGAGIVIAIQLNRDRDKDSSDKPVAQGPVKDTPREVGPQLPRPLVEWPFKDAGGAPAADARGLKVFVRGKHVRTVPLTQPIREKSLEVWFRIADLNQEHSMLVSLNDGVKTWDGIQYADLNRHEWYPGSSFRNRSARLTGPVETARPTDLIHLVMLYPTGGQIILYRNGILHGQFRPTGPDSNLQSYPEASSLFVIGGDPDGQRPFQGDIKLARLYDRALTEAEIMALFKGGKDRSSGTTGTPVTPSTDTQGPVSSKTPPETKTPPTT